MTKLILRSGDGTVLHELRSTAEDLLARAEQHARVHHLAKRSYFPQAVRQEIETAGYRVADGDLDAAMARLDALRRGETMEQIHVRVTPGERGTPSTILGEDMPPTSLIAQRFFESERSYPNAGAREWYDRLVGLDDQKQQLLLELELLLYPDRLIGWSRKHHGAELRACSIMANRAPLILLEGDVGCGKTALAETVGDPLAEKVGGKVHLLKVNTQVRGTGMVGEMTDLIVQAFTQAEARADALKGDPLILLIDEADALAAKRVDQHMHHEDKAGLNTLLQRIDGLRLAKRRIVVIFITNRPDALDPAVRRRAALRLSFGRPNDEMRAELFRQSVPELELTSKQLRDLVSLTGTDAKKSYGAVFTASDITDRLLPGAMRRAYAAGRPLSASDLIELAKLTEPTPAIYGSATHEE